MCDCRAGFQLDGNGRECNGESSAQNVKTIKGRAMVFILLIYSQISMSVNREQICVTKPVLTLTVPIHVSAPRVSDSTAMDRHAMVYSHYKAAPVAIDKRY